MMPTVRVTGGVWKHQADERANLQRRLEETTARLCDARNEVDRVHAQCVVLLREKNELAVSLEEATGRERRHADELHAAKQNIAELMTLLTPANEARTRIEKERAAVTSRWQHARDREHQATREIAVLRTHVDEQTQEAARLRDLLYAAQEENTSYEQALDRERELVRVAVHSNEAKDRQIVTLVRERDAYAQMLAQCRSRSTEGKPLASKAAKASEVRAATPMEDSCESVTWTDVAPRTDATTVVEFERQKQRLRDVALQTKSRLEKERAHNAMLVKRIDALETSQQELLVRYREASKSRRQRVAGIAETASESSSVQAA